MRIALGIEYDGSQFSGWQQQQNLKTVQGSLEAAISKVANEKIELFCAGRTDAGVHATGQIIHFDTNANRPMRAWVEGVNTYLQSTISVQWAQPVENNFHARFSATARRYRYVIYNHSSRPAILHAKVSWYFQKLDAPQMHEAALCLVGEHDFSSFRSSQCESPTAMRHVKEISVTQKNHFIIIEIEANAFLHHMVRNIVGSLLPIGAGIKTTEWLKEVFAVRDRKLAGETAKPDGLYLINVKYPEIYGLPKMQNSILFL